MPGLQLYRRTWLVASDDLVIPFGVGLILRSAWFIILSIIFGVHLSYGHESTIGTEGHSCERHRVHLYFIGYIVLLFLTAVIDIIITALSSRGTIFNNEPRKHIPTYLYTRTFLFIIEILWCILGLYYIFFRLKFCPNTYDKLIAQLVVIFNLIWILGTFITIYLCFDVTGDIYYKLRKKDKHRSKYGSVDTLECKKNILRKKENSWKKNFSFLFCCTKTENSKDNVLLLASKVFSSYFDSYTNLVPSDILAGLILLRQKQKYEESKRIKEELKNTNASYHEETKHKSHRSVRRHQKTVHSSPFDMDSESDVQVLDCVTYFAKYALACYGWPMYCLLNKIPICSSPACRLLKHVRCCGNCRESPDYYPHVTGDNCCLCNYATQKVILENINENYIYVSYSDEVFYTPFNVILDHAREVIVISCRGTLSLKDVLTDLSIEEEPIPGADPNSNFTAHNGFLQAALAIKDKLEEKELIEQARNFDTSKGTQNYKLVIVGHSLGAGTATILAFLLRSKYPDLQCYAYGPSGSAVSYEASVHAESFIHSVILGKDLVARLNLNTLKELQHNIMQMLEKTKLPKWRILHGCMCNCLLCCTRSSNHSFNEYFDSEDEITSFEPYQSENESKLYMAGKVVHICKTKSIYPRFGFKEATYQAFWSTPNDFQNILISNLMLQDHFPDSLINALTKILPDDIEEIFGSMDSGSAIIHNSPPQDSPRREMLEGESLISPVSDSHIHNEVESPGIDSSGDCYLNEQDNLISAVIT